MCEGEFDTIIAEDALGLPAVGIPGVQNWKPHYAKVFEGYARVLILADDDSSKHEQRVAEGKKSKNSGAEFSKLLCSKLDNAIPVKLPRDMDVSDLVLARGADALRDLCDL